tara:strand:- start:115 stop:285 length:171 start_codon:yes stop_codon:yes gene_type:complete
MGWRVEMVQEIKVEVVFVVIVRTRGELWFVAAPVRSWRWEDRLEWSVWTCVILVFV